MKKSHGVPVHVLLKRWLKTVNAVLSNPMIKVKQLICVDLEFCYDAVGVAWSLTVTTRDKSWV